MIEDVEKLNAKLQAASFLRPTERDRLGKREIKIRPVWPVHDACRAVAEGRSKSGGWRECQRNPPREVDSAGVQLAHSDRAVEQAPGELQATQWTLRSLSMENTRVASFSPYEAPFSSHWFIHILCAFTHHVRIAGQQDK
jgi:hypothetical protein